MLAKPKRYLWTDMFMKNIRHQCQSCPLSPLLLPLLINSSVSPSPPGEPQPPLRYRISDRFFGYGQPVVGEIRAIYVVPKIALAFHDYLTI